MSFSFDFAVDDENADKFNVKAVNVGIYEKDIANYGEVLREEVFDPKSSMICESDEPITMRVIDLCIHGSLSIRIKDTSDVNYADDAGRITDIIPRQYEGGLKLWECSVDLAEHLIDRFANCSSTSLETFLELGCGHAIPSIVAMKLGFRGIWCSDYNREVLVDVTWPNIHLNSSNEVYSTFRCTHGDWMCLSAELQRSQHPRFDVIVAAETLYNEETTFKTCWMIDHHLSYTGIAILATKRYYFGVGGGRGLIERIINESNDFSLCIESVKSFEDGSSNIRDILIVRQRKE
jgi:predicted DNA-binding protein